MELLLTKMILHWTSHWRNLQGDQVQVHQVQVHPVQVHQVQVASFSSLDYHSGATGKNPTSRFGRSQGKESVNIVVSCVSVGAQANLQLIGSIYSRTHANYFLSTGWRVNNGHDPTAKPASQSTPTATILFDLPPLSTQK